MDVGQRELRIQRDNLLRGLASQIVPNVNIPHPNARTLYARFATADIIPCFDVLGD